MEEHKRTAEEYIILSLTGASTLLIAPFFIIRFLEQHWSLATLDLVAVLTMAAIFVRVWVSHETYRAGQLLAFLCGSLLFVTVYLGGIAQLFWSYPALAAMFFLLTPRLAALLSILILLSLLPIVTAEPDVKFAATYYVSIIGVLSFNYVFAYRTREHSQQLQLLTTSDSLTGAKNRRAFEEKLLDIVTLQQRHPSPVAMILFDVDNFKLLNDKHGHQLGDHILKQIADVIRQRIRTTDNLYRYGGEEFVVITENATSDAAAKLAEELRNAIQSSIELAKYSSTISLGVAQYHINESGFDWLARADRAMYQAKAAGRNLSRVA
ncbi:GGDEF domain-containing protein [Alteromonadaceae bacterium BrNp21-10]|nr:GGDEF domain-containing protein [Alteromonadaceae bacterium BrNp21-10]